MPYRNEFPGVIPDKRVPLDAVLGNGDDVTRCSHMASNGRGLGDQALQRGDWWKEPKSLPAAHQNIAILRQYFSLLHQFLYGTQEKPLAKLNCKAMCQYPQWTASSPQLLRLGQAGHIPETISSPGGCCQKLPQIAGLSPEVEVLLSMVSPAFYAAP